MAPKSSCVYFHFLQAHTQHSCVTGVAPANNRVFNIVTREKPDRGYHFDIRHHYCCTRWPYLIGALATIVKWPPIVLIVDIYLLINCIFSFFDGLSYDCLLEAIIVYGLHLQIN